MSLFFCLLGLMAQAGFDEVHITGPVLTFRLPSANDSIYVLEQTARLAGPWTSQSLVQGTGAALSLTNEISSSAQFFRARILPRILVSKPGDPFQLSLATSNDTGQWHLEGELPSGLQFTNALLSGTPSDEAAEKFTTGDYTNHLHLQPLAGSESMVEIIHHVRLSFSRNIYPERLAGPSLGSICLHCHGTGFPPNFTPDATTISRAKSVLGEACSTGLPLVTPGDPASSLIYQKITAPLCGSRMPDGGPYLPQIALDRVKRWISELTAEDKD